MWLEKGMNYFCYMGEIFSGKIKSTKSLKIFISIDHEQKKAQQKE